MLQNYNNCFYYFWYLLWLLVAMLQLAMISICCKAHITCFIPYKKNYSCYKGHFKDFIVQVQYICSVNNFNVYFFQYLVLS
jgi:hypothetical protein